MQKNIFNVPFYKNNMVRKSEFQRLNWALFKLNPCCFPSAFALHSYIISLMCTCTNIKARVKSKPVPGCINKSLMPWSPSCPQAVVYTESKMELAFPLKFIQNCDTPNQICLESRAIWLSKICQSREMYVIVPNLCLPACQADLVSGWLVCLAAQYVWTEQSEQRAGLWQTCPLTAPHASQQDARRLLSSTDWFKTNSLLSTDRRNKQAHRDFTV